jgi:hypothetical protein
MVKEFLDVGGSEVHPVKPMGLFCLTGAKIHFRVDIECMIQNPELSVYR